MTWKAPKWLPMTVYGPTLHECAANIGKALETLEGTAKGTGIDIEGRFYREEGGRWVWAGYRRAPV